MHNRKLNRLKNYDYSQCGTYFVTICTHNHIEYFGKIENNAMILNSNGEIAKKFWQEMPRHYGDVDLDVFAILPNHIHGIVIIKPVGNAYMRSLQNTDRTKMLLSVVIQQFKSAVARQIHTNLDMPNFQWQKSFYDHVIRNERSLENIRNYIVYNHLKWLEDIENKHGYANVKDYYDKIIRP